MGTSLTSQPCGGWKGLVPDQVNVAPCSAGVYNKRAVSGGALRENHRRDSAAVELEAAWSKKMDLIKKRSDSLRLWTAFLCEMIDLTSAMPLLKVRGMFCRSESRDRAQL